MTLAKPQELNLGWLDFLPNSKSLCLHLCLKGLDCKSNNVQDVLRKLNIPLHSCVEEPGGHEFGHEGVCTFRFLMDNYNRPWTGVYFMHADVPHPKHTRQFKALNVFLQRHEWVGWLGVEPCQDL